MISMQGTPANMLFFIGESKSSGSKYLVQLVIATFGQFASKRFKHPTIAIIYDPTNKLATCLFTKPKTASVFLAEEYDRRDGNSLSDSVGSTSCCYDNCHECELVLASMNEYSPYFLSHELIKVSRHDILLYCIVCYPPQ